MNKMQVVMLAVLISLQMGCLRSESGYLVKNGKMNAHLLVPEKLTKVQFENGYDPKNIKTFIPNQKGKINLRKKFKTPLLFAVKELREYFYKMTESELPVIWNGAVSVDGNHPSIQLVVRNDKEWEGKESAQSFVIQEDPSKGVIITGNTELAVLYGVYQYLEELGVKWFSPGEIGENIPKLANIAIKKRKKTYTPSFLERGISLSGIHRNHFDYSDVDQYWNVYNYEYSLWLIRNHMAFQRYILRQNLFDFNHSEGSGGHGIRAVLKAYDKKKDIKCFPLITRDDGQKRRFKFGQICFTNKKNIKKGIKLAVDYFKKQQATKNDRNSDLDEVMDSFPLGLSDNTGICECSNCKKVAGNGPHSNERLAFYYFNHVAKGLNKKMPGKKISLYYPYFELNACPEGMQIEPNIVAVNCRVIAYRKNKDDKKTYPFVKDFSENVEAIRKAGAEMRIYNYSSWHGCPQPLHFLDAVDAYKKMGYKHYHAEVMNRHEQMWPILWATAQCITNSNKSSRELLTEYCNKYYGKAGSVILKLIETMDENSRTMAMFIYGGVVGTQYIMTDSFIADGRKKLTIAIKEAKGKEKIRLELFKDTFEMFAQTAETYRAHCRSLNIRTPEAIANSQKKFAAYEQLWKTRNLAKTCSPRALFEIKRLKKSKITPTTEPKKRKQLVGKTQKDKEWLADLFAFDKVPKKIPNLFALPEIWEFKLDYKNEGLNKGWEKVNYKGKGWNKISTWNFFERQGYKSIDGYFWYRVKFKAPKFPAGKMILMRIGSLDDAGDIYINGKLAYSRKFRTTNDWQTSFEFDVTKFIKQGQKNTIAVNGFDSFGAGGLWRPSAIYTN